MGNFKNIILIVILIIAAGNLTRNLMTDSNLNSAQENLVFTKNELNAAISSNQKAKSQIESLQNLISGHRVKNERLTYTIDSIITAYRRQAPIDYKAKDSLIKRITTINNKLAVLREKDTIFE